VADGGTGVVWVDKAKNDAKGGKPPLDSPKPLEKTETRDAEARVMGSGSSRRYLVDEC
jgi:hypothetical protein